MRSAPPLTSLSGSARTLVRCSLTNVTVANSSAWIMQAFIMNRPTGTGNGNPSVAVIKYDSVLEVLDWGRTGPWKDMPTSDKGVVFENYFVRAVRQLRLDAFGNVRVWTALCIACWHDGNRCALTRL